MGEDLINTESVYYSILPETQNSYDITTNIENLAYQAESIDNKFDYKIDQVNKQIYDLNIQLQNSMAEQYKLKDQLNKKVMLVHNCANCGATLNIEENKPIFHCRYCGSTYIIGATQLYSNY